MTMCIWLQGLQRVQQAPAISKAMHSLLWRCQQRIGHWVGSSVIHLGDHNVPNALMFIDKYTQVGRDCCARCSSFGRTAAGCTSAGFCSALSPATKCCHRL